MMIGEWQEAEPEIGQVAMAHSTSRGNFLGICRLNRSGDKVWYDENSGREYDLDKVDEWAPITTPEERRLKRKVEELEGKLLILRNSIINAPIVLNTSGMIHRWSDDLVMMLDKKTGAGGVGDA